MNVQTQPVLINKNGVATKKDPHIPDFLIIGAGKSGTTSLDNYLKQHPQIFIPQFKEPNFYGYENNTPEDFKDNPGELTHYKNSVTDLQSYLKLFEKALPFQVIGETSNTYMYHEGAAARIKYYNPNMKLIAVLRNPAERLYSRFLHLAREDRRPTEEFSDCLKKDTIWWQRNDLIKEGFYFRHLSKFFRSFPSQNIRIFLYEELNKQPDRVLKEIYSFLGVDPSFKTDLSIRYNESGLIKNRFWDKIYGQHGVVVKTIKAMLPESINSMLRENLFIQKKLNTLRSKNLLKPKLDPKLKARLTKEVYADDIRNLQRLIQKDLSHWLEGI
jgi:hypothetical protein